MSTFACVHIAVRADNGSRLGAAILSPALRPRSHYGRNDDDGMVMFYRSHYMFRNANVNATWPSCDVNVDVTMAAMATLTATVFVGVVSDLRK